MAKLRKTYFTISSVKYQLTSLNNGLLIKIILIKIKEILLNLKELKY